MENTVNKRNNSIDIFRYLCALLIVAIHVHPLMQFGSRYNILFVDYFTRIGVPFFFVTAGYFYSKKLLDGKKPFKNYIIKLLKIYLFWSAVYAVFSVVKTLSENKFDGEAVKELILGFLYRGVSEHLWFVPSLVVAICILTLFHKLGAMKVLYVLSTVLFTFACIGFTYKDAIGSRIHVLYWIYTSDYFTVIHRLLCFGTTFVTMGAIICRYEKALTKRNTSFYAFLCVLFYLAFVLEKIAAEKFGFGTNFLYNFALYSLMLAIFLTLLKEPLYKRSKPALYLRNASSFTYFSHVLFMYFYYELFHSSLLVYFLVCITTTLISFSITKVNSKKLNFLNS